MLPIDPETGEIPDVSIQEKARIIFRNLSAIAKQANVTLNHAVKTTVFLTDINDFKSVNEVYEQYFSASLSKWSAFQAAALHLGAQIEVGAIFQI